MDQVKEAFKKVKEDIDLIKNEITSLNLEIQNLKITLNNTILSENYASNNPTIQQKNPTNLISNPTDNWSFKPLKAQNMPSSTGNDGVPTDKQTNQQTNQQTEKTYFGNAIEVLNSLDNIKKEIRLKFKELTEQEFLVFSILYQLDEEKGYADYKTLSEKLDLSESSVRDYIGKLIKKEIPVEKIKIKNKNIRLSISSNLKKIATLNTILQLRVI